MFCSVLFDGNQHLQPNDIDLARNVCLSVHLSVCQMVSLSVRLCAHIALAVLKIHATLCLRHIGNSSKVIKKCVMAGKVLSKRRHM